MCQLQHVLTQQIVAKIETIVHLSVNLVKHNVAAH